MNSKSGFDGLRGLAGALVFAGAVFSAPAGAAVLDVSIRGSDAIFLAGRTDLVIPPAGVLWPGGLGRHPVTPEQIQETLPPILSVNAGDVIRAADPAVGGISFFNGFGAPFFGPDGNGLSGANLGSFGGISGYLGPQGPLVGVFLDASIPSAGAPARLNFNPVASGGLGTDFLSLAPDLGQVFYIGNGVTSGNVFQEFLAPTGATRLALGIADGFGFVGFPGAYDDNDGGYRIRIGINQLPVPEPQTLALLLAGLGVIGTRRLARG